MSARPSIVRKTHFITGRRERVRLVILDAHMPIVDGLEVRRTQLADPALRTSRSSV